MSGRIVVHNSGMREYVPGERGFRMKEGEDLLPALLELTRAVRGIDARLRALEPQDAAVKRIAMGGGLPEWFIAERKAEKIKRRTRQAFERIAQLGLGVLACILIARPAWGLTELPVTGMRTYFFTEPISYYNADQRYISDRLTEFLVTKAELEAARGTKPTIDERLDESLNPDGTLKESAASTLVGQWKTEAASPSYLTDLTFTLSDTADLTDVYVAGRRVLMHGSSGYVYATVISSEYEDPGMEVEVGGATVPADIDSVLYGTIAESRALPEYTTLFVGTSATFSEGITVAGEASVGSLTAATGSFTTGAGPGKVMGCLDTAGRWVWTSLGALALSPGQVLSTHIAAADGTSGNTDISTGSGIKTPHIQDSAVTLAKMGPDVKYTAGTQYGLVFKNFVGMCFNTSFGGPGNKYPIIGGAPNMAWHLCDGTDGTPDLRGRMVIGYYPGGTGDNADFNTVGNTGGLKTHAHSDGTLSAASRSCTFSLTAGAQSGIYNTAPGTGGPQVPAWNHTQPVTGTITAPAADVSGATGSASSLSPYYVLAYIMRI